MARVLKKGDLRVYHIPQVPMKAFYVDVNDLVEAVLVMNLLADYDQFQLDNRVKPDYSNANGLEVYEPEGKDESPGSEWCSWYPEATPGFEEACNKMFEDEYVDDNILRHLTLDQMRTVVNEMNRSKP